MRHERDYPLLLEKTEPDAHVKRFVSACEPYRELIALERDRVNC